RAKPGPGRRPLVHGELLTQGEVLDHELAVATAEEREQPKQVEQESDHRAGMVPGSEPTDQPLGRRIRFWRRTGVYLAFLRLLRPCVADRCRPRWTGRAKRREHFGHFRMRRLD